MSTSLIVFIFYPLTTNSRKATLLQEIPKHSLGFFHRVKKQDTYSTNFFYVIIVFRLRVDSYRETCFLERFLPRHKVIL